MEGNFYAVVVAGGSGTRIGGPVPKQFIELEGIPILHRTIMRLRAAWPSAHIVTVLPRSSMDFWKEHCLSHFSNCPQLLVEGGITRFHSVRNALAKIPDGAVVAVHDGVRPLVSVELLQRMAGMMDDGVRAVIPVVPVTDTLKGLERDADGVLHETGGPEPDRSRIFAAQTPQIFRSEDLRAAYDLPYDTRFTDDCSVAREAGIPITYTEGERFNIKITTPSDLLLASALLRL